MKRVFDIVSCLLAAPLLAPFFLLVGLGVKISSPGPVFYRGKRSGRGGELFRIYKFRSMVPNGESLGGGTTALNDPRIFPFGQFLRKYKIDELPQIFNVLLGDMSIVGPRPELPQYTRQYIGEEVLILSVRPGITDNSSIYFSSLDQVVGEVDADRTFEEKILKKKNAMRVDYVKNRTFIGDICLILRTIICVLTKGLKK